MIHHFLLISNPFIDSYLQSDILGKLIFIALITSSILSWVILIQKVQTCREAQKNSLQFRNTFQSQRHNPLNLEPQKLKSPFEALYQVLKRYTLEILNKNSRFHQKDEQTAPSLSEADLDFVQAQLMTGISNQIKQLEKNLFILSTVVTLAPFLGLLGTVWGILTTFSEMQNLSSLGQSAILSGLSLALATTVLGLITAIPALIGYNYLKNLIRDFQTDMESYSNEMLASVEIQYRRVDKG
ncbi:MAG: MotA/TolQ/ExbB proton channel family protein [Chlamydiia bacterium]|nr:MotA/TolQ/ExbB proton channel family protein [Chlamydiia bacterium]